MRLKNERGNSPVEWSDIDPSPSPQVYKGSVTMFDFSDQRALLCPVQEFEGGAVLK